MKKALAAASAFFLSSAHEKDIFAVSLVGSEPQIEKAEEARKKNQKMYKTLGVVVGLVFVIILI